MRLKNDVGGFFATNEHIFPIQFNTRKLRNDEIEEI